MHVWHGWANPGTPGHMFGLLFVYYMAPPFLCEASISGGVHGTLTGGFYLVHEVVQYTCSKYLFMVHLREAFSWCMNLFHIHTCSIYTYLFNILVQYTCSIYLFNILVPYTCSNELFYLVSKKLERENN